MKIVYILFVLLLFIPLSSSCDKDIDKRVDNSEIPTQLLGKWKYEGYTVNEGPFEENLLNVDGIYEIKTGGTFTVTNDYDDEIEYRGTYTVNNDSLTVSYDGKKFSYSINQLTNNSLQISVQEIDDTGTLDVVYNFTKVN